MTTPNTPERTGNPFALDATEFPFSDALIIQAIASPTHLQATVPGRQDTEGGGFFIEAEVPPLEHFEAATLITGSGKRVAGFAARTFLFFPVAFRVRWEAGEPGNRIPVRGYVEGARSRTTVLAMLETGKGVKLTAGGLASKSISSACREHMYAQAKHQRQSFAAALSGVAGSAKQVKGTLVTPFQFVSLSNEACPVELGWQIRERWDEVQAWRTPTPAFALRTPSSPTAANGSGVTDRPVYGNGEPLADNQAERNAFQAFIQAADSTPGDRDALRVWYQEQAGHPAEEVK